MTKGLGGIIPKGGAKRGGEEGRRRRRERRGRKGRRGRRGRREKGRRGGLAGGGDSGVGEELGEDFDGEENGFFGE